MVLFYFNIQFKIWILNHNILVEQAINSISMKLICIQVYLEIKFVPPNKIENGCN